VTLDYLLTAFIVCLSPGIGLVYTLSATLGGGFRAGIWASVGCTLATVLHMIVAMAGLAAILHTSAVLFQTIKFAGVAYLLWMAWNLWRDAKSPFIAEDSRPVPRSPLLAYRLGLWTNLSNPKAVVMYSSIFLGTIGPGTPGWVLACLIVLILVAETAWNSLVARIFSLDRTRAAYISLKTVIDRCFGAALAVLGVKIVAT